MPQGGRKFPFSGKAKKQQLQVKKEREQGKAQRSVPYRADLADSDDETGSEAAPRPLYVGHSKKLNAQPTSGRAKANRYALQFREDSREEDARCKELARKALNYVPESALEVDPLTPYPKELDFPKRPPWDSSMGREILEAREQKYFRDFIDDLKTKFDLSELSFFELNLETWRQLWRVLEMSDIVLFIVDIRFPVYLFPPMLYTYVTKTLCKDMILVLNKVDLAPAPLVLAWKYFFKNQYPELQVLMFTAFPGYNLRQSSTKPGGLKVRRQKGKMKMAFEGAQQVLQACENVVGGKVDLSSWRKKIAEELHQEFEDEELEIGETIEQEKIDTGYVEHEKYVGGVLTIGCIGQPNVGKSSLMNALMGKKVVSVSRTPGHTKHFQTIFLTPTVRLCDCPGLVFPSKVPKTLQVLMGSYPIAQLREPFSSVQYLAERLNLVAMLKLHHPENDTEWSAFDVCDAWAKQRGFYTAKAARLDSYRAANHLLRMALDGKICLCLYPPQYVASKAKWENHEELAQVLRIQAKEFEDEKYDITCSSDLVNSDDEDMESSQEDNGSPSAEASAESDDGGIASNIASNKFALLGDGD